MVWFVCILFQKTEEHEEHPKKSFACNAWFQVSAKVYCFSFSFMNVCDFEFFFSYTHLCQYIPMLNASIYINDNQLPSSLKHQKLLCN